jgi:hypothetical protein
MNALKDSIYMVAGVVIKPCIMLSNSILGVGGEFCSGWRAGLTRANAEGLLYGQFIYKADIATGQDHVELYKSFQVISRWFYPKVL